MQWIASIKLGPCNLPRTPKESETSPKGRPIPGSSRVSKECATESEKSPKRVRSCVFGLFSDSVAHSLGTLGLPGAGRPFGLFSDSFGVLGRLQGPGDLCAWSGGSQMYCIAFKHQINSHLLFLMHLMFSAPMVSALLPAWTHWGGGLGCHGASALHTLEHVRAGQELIFECQLLRAWKMTRECLGLLGLLRFVATSNTTTSIRAIWAISFFWPRKRSN